MITVLPITAILFILGFLAITGVPPFGTFLTEFSIMASGMKDHTVVVIVALLALVLAFIGFLQYVVSMIFGEAPHGIVKGEAGAWVVLPVILLVGILVFLSVGIPGIMESLLRNAVLNTSL